MAEPVASLVSLQPGVRVEVCDLVDDGLVGAFARLHPQLSSSPPPDAEALGRIVGHPANTVLIARTAPDEPSDGAPDEIVGAMILVLFPLASGLRAWIEDVVVDESARGRGIGAALNRHAIEIARQAGARTVDLTSRPDREAANRLYARLGFNQRSTNVYRLDL
ncbi:MAG: GNAT family N-acetyltransferase [Acidimicrobiaceae bacterium]|nr:GNAT family N-acetyltransferase [Acidimicrobiaceae bacterium]